MKIVIKFIVFSLLVTANNSFAHAQKMNNNGAMYCPVSKDYNNDYAPKTFASSNNLLKKPGMQVSYCGEKIVVYGKVIDRSCRPVPYAKVNIWQVNCKGRYPYEALKKSADDPYILLNEGNSFIGNGTAISDDEGEFAFVTIYPRAVHNLPSHINIKVQHEKAGSVQTILPLKDNRAVNARMQSVARSEEGANAYFFEVTLPGADIVN